MSEESDASEGGERPAPRDGADTGDRAETETELRYYRAAMENLPDTVIVADDDGRVTWACPNVSTIFGYTDQEVVEMGTVETLLGPALFDGADLEARGQLPNIERRITDKQGREHVLLVSVESVDIGAGSVLYACRDVTERMDAERRLEDQRDLKRYRRIVETAADGIYVLDSDRQFTMVNDEFTTITGYDRATLIGAHAEITFGAEFLDVEAAKQADPERDQHETAVLEEQLQTATGDSVTVESRFSLVEFEDGATGRVGIVRDVTDRVEYERELEQSRRRYRTLVDNFPNGGVALFDEALRYLVVGGEMPAQLDDTDTLEGQFVEDALPEALLEQVRPQFEVALAGEWSTTEVTVGDQIRTLHTLPVRNADGEVIAGMAMSQDVTEQRRYEQELETRIRQQSAITGFGQSALGTDDIDELFDEAVSLVAATLDADYCKVLDLLPDGDALHLRAGVGWHEGLVGTATVPTEADSQAGYTLLSEAPVVVPAMDAETRFAGPELLTEHDVQSGISVIIGTPEAPWGVLGTHETTTRRFSEHDVTFVQAVANILTTAIDRAEHERQIERQREGLAALNNLNGISRDIIHTLVQQSTREAVERLVCTRLADSDSYEFAWVGTVDDTGEVVVRTEAGVEGYLDDIRIEVGDETGRGPTGRAFETGTVEVCQDVMTDPTYAAWRDRAGEYGYRASAAVPISHEKTTHGVLNIYTDRGAAFDGEELEVVTQLGEVMGHVITAIERKRLVMSDDAIGVEFGLRDVFAELDLDGTPDGEFTIEQTIPAGEETYLAYGTATPEGMATLHRLVEQLDSWTAVTVIDEGVTDSRFEVRLSSPPVLDIVTGYGGYVRTAKFADGGWRLTANLPPDAPVREVVEQVQQEYPKTDVLAQRRTATVDRQPGPLGADLADLLTERQATAIETAYAAGFFEWPRARTGEQIAEALDIAPPTFHQHLRAAERAVLSALIEG